MGSIRSRQGSATLTSARRTSRLGIAAVAAVVVAFVWAAPAMASDVSVDSKGELYFRAYVGFSNAVVFSGDGSAVTVTDPVDLPVAGAGCTTVDPATVTCAGVTRLEVEVRDENDLATNDTGLPSVMSAQNGDDNLTGGSGLDVLRGDNGNDVLDGRGGDDTLIGDGATTIGDDHLIGGDGIDRVSYGAASLVRVDLSAPGAQDTGDGVDTISGVENVNGTGGNDMLIGNDVPNTILGKGGDDEIRVRSGGADAVNCGSGFDLVVLDRSDTLLDPHACEEVNDGEIPNNTVITDGPTGPTADARWSFTSDEPWAEFECAVVQSADELDSAAWSTCSSGEPVSAPEGVPSIFAVRAFDDQDNRDQAVTRDFTLDTTAPQTRIDSGPSGGGVTTDPTPEFFFSSEDPDVTGFLCRFDTGSFFVCASPLTADPLPDGLHTLEVVASDAAGNFDQTPAKVEFRIDTSTAKPGPGDGPPPNPQTPAPPPPASSPVQQAKIIIGSLVLISGNTVRVSRKGRVRIRLTCAGARMCRGRLSITTAAPVRKKSRKLVTLGAKKFTIGANRKRRINVRFPKRKLRLAKRLKRFKAKAIIREIDERGNPRISSRIFVMRAR